MSRKLNRLLEVVNDWSNDESSNIAVAIHKALEETIKRIQSDVDFSLRAYRIEDEEEKLELTKEITELVLLHTGMRVSEFCGLTIKDLDFENRRINVDHQLLRKRNGEYEVEETKSDSGRRYIAMDDDVYISLKNILANRPKAKVEMVVDGYTGFIMLDKNERPKVALHLENECRWSLKKYAKLHPDKPLPTITPHVLRHTFCTDMHFLGLDPKSLQYFMGHSEARTTMNIYTHASYEQAKSALTKVLKFTTQNASDEETSKAL